MLAETDDPRKRALLGLTGFVGCRVAEAISIAPGDFDLHEMLVKIRGKGDKTRIVPVSTKAWDILEYPVIRAFGLGWPTVVGYKDRMARKVITDLAAAAKLKRTVSSHDLRATFATAAYNGSKDIRAVQTLLGHASVTTTEVYTAVNIAAMREAVELV